MIQNENSSMYTNEAVIFIYILVMYYFTNTAINNKRNVLVFNHKQ